MYGIPEGVPLRKVEVTYDNEVRAFFLTPRGGRGGLQIQICLGGCSWTARAFRCESTSGSA
jgi:hypothetical protein